MAAASGVRQEQQLAGEHDGGHHGHGHQQVPPAWHGTVGVHARASAPGYLGRLGQVSKILWIVNGFSGLATESSAMTQMEAGRQSNAIQRIRCQSSESTLQGKGSSG